LRWFTQNSIGLDVHIEDISEQVAALALQGPTSGKLLKSIAEADIANLKYFRFTSGKIAGVPVDISRTGYTGDLGYEIWIPWKQAVTVWDELMTKGRSFDIHAAGMLALDVARIEAGLILIDVDYFSSKKALIEQQKYFPQEIGLGKLVHLEKDQFIGRKALAERAKKGFPRKIVGLEIDWTHVEQLYEHAGLAPQAPSQASRVHVPVYRGNKQVGRATSTTWSPILKKMIALASLNTRDAVTGNQVEMEITIEAVRKNVRATVIDLPFYNPPHKTAKIG
jgi:aminomethyltransferase